MIFKHISSRDNSLFKGLKKLADTARERRKQGKALLDGAHLVGAYADVFGVPSQIIVAEGDCTEDVLALLDRFGDIEALMFPTAMFAEISPVARPTGILALVDIPQLPPPSAIGFGLMLEDIQDPGNLGSILRSAAAAGVEVVYLSESCADAWSPKTLRGGQGAHFMLPIVERVDLLAQMAIFQAQTLAGSPLPAQILATAMHGDALYQLDLTGPLCFLIGNEGAGVSEALLQAASRRVHIPMPGKIESLNVAAAAAICLFERARQISP